MKTSDPNDSGSFLITFGVMATVALYALMAVGICKIIF
jgi:hypothetical protein